MRALRRTVREIRARRLAKEIIPQCIDWREDQRFPDLTDNDLFYPFGKSQILGYPQSLTAVGFEDGGLRVHALNMSFCVGYVNGIYEKSLEKARERPFYLRIRVGHF